MTRLPGILLAILLPEAALATEVLLSVAAPFDTIAGAHAADVTQARVWGLPVNTPVQIAPAAKRVGRNRAAVQLVYVRQGSLWWGASGGAPVTSGLVQRVPDLAAWVRFHVQTLRLFRAVAVRGRNAHRAVEIESLDGQLRLRAELPTPGTA